MDQNDELDLHYGKILVGRVIGVFCHQGTWFGTLKLSINPNDNDSSQRIFDYIEFCKEWNESQKTTDPADAIEFDNFMDIIRSGLWSTENTKHEKTNIVDAPVFFMGGDISWVEADPR